MNVDFVLTQIHAHTHTYIHIKFLGKCHLDTINHTESVKEKNGPPVAAKGRRNAVLGGFVSSWWNVGRG